MVVQYKRDFIIVDGGHFMEYEPESGRAVVINNSLYRVLLYEREFNMLQSNARQLPLDDAEKLLGIMPQEEYFEQELKSLSNTQANLRLYGWDNELMDNPQYRKTLNALGQKTPPVAVSAILQDGQAQDLEGLICNANVRRISSAIDAGIIIFDGKEVSLWDSKRKSEYTPESQSAIYRAHFPPKQYDLQELMFYKIVGRSEE